MCISCHNFFIPGPRLLGIIVTLSWAGAGSQCSESAPQEAVQRHLLVGRPHGAQRGEVRGQLGQGRGRGQRGRQLGAGVAGLGVGGVAGAQGEGAGVGPPQARGPAPEQLTVGGQLGLLQAGRGGGARAGGEPHARTRSSRRRGVHLVGLQQLHVARGQARRGGEGQPRDVGVVARHGAGRLPAARVLAQRHGTPRAAARRAAGRAHGRHEAGRGGVEAGARGPEGGVGGVVGRAGHGGERGELWLGGEELQPGLDDGRGAAGVLGLGRPAPVFGLVLGAGRGHCAHQHGAARRARPGLGRHGAARGALTALTVAVGLEGDLVPLRGAAAARREIKLFGFFFSF